MLSALLLLSTANQANANAGCSGGCFGYDELPTSWRRPGTCYNLWYDCLYGLFGVNNDDNECDTCLEHCEAAVPDDDPSDVPAPGYTPENPGICGDIDRTDCERTRIHCYKRCDENNDYCPEGRYIEGNLCYRCYDECDNFWVPQCELKQNWEQNGESYSFEPAECLDRSKWPDPYIGAGECCKGLVPNDYVNFCQGKVADECAEQCWDLAYDDWDAAELCLEKCACAYTQYQGAQGEFAANGGVARCEEIGAVSAQNTVAIPNGIPNAVYAMGALIAILLACIAGLLTWAVCVRPLLSAASVKYVDVNADEPL